MFDTSVLLKNRLSSINAIMAILFICFILPGSRAVPTQRKLAFVFAGLPIRWAYTNTILILYFLFFFLRTKILINALRTYMSFLRTRPNLNLSNCQLNRRREILGCIFASVRPYKFVIPVTRTQTVKILLILWHPWGFSRILSQLQR